MSDSDWFCMFVKVPLIVPVNINGQSLRVIIRRSEPETNRTVGWLIEEIIRLYTCDNSAGNFILRIKLNSCPNGEGGSYFSFVSVVDTNIILIFTLIKRLSSGV